jgi:protein SCO1/2
MVKLSRLLFAAALLALGAAAAAASAWPGASLYNLESMWTTQDGASVALDAFAGRPLVVAMGYTTCRDICPAVVADMMWVEKHLLPGAGPHVRFAFVSFDSEADTPERMKLYAESHGLDPDRWTLLRGGDDAVRELAAALDVPFRPNDQGGFDHAVVISLLNAKGEIVFQQRGAQASSEALLNRLEALLSTAD